MPNRLLRTCLVAAVIVGATGLTACSEGALREEAEGIASAARDSASTAAVDAVRDQVCQVVGDNQVSEQDQRVLEGLVDAAQAAGVESDVLTALEDVTGADGTPPESAVGRLVDACRQ